ncbi:MAG: FadR family transcriptional regulator [Chloroflexi bacterium]|nr:FadR family transcriptional regulator [Chloroflexota bacterium]
MVHNQSSYELLNYLISTSKSEVNSNHIPSLKELSQQLEVSIALLREQLEVAKAFGFVDVRPRTGIKRLPYSFLPAVRQSLFYAIEIDRKKFQYFSDLRNHVEAAYWYEAAASMTKEDIDELRGLVESAWKKLRNPQIQIPHQEHRSLHLSIYKRLDNPFVQGILEAYWEAYESVGLQDYAGFDYLEKVWNYHQRMVELISSGDFYEGYRVLVEHSNMIHHLLHLKPLSSDPAK